MGRGHRLPEETTDMIRGLGLSYNTAAIVDIAPGICRSDDDTTDIKVTATDTVSLAVSGDGGLDTGSEAASTWYYVWVILNPTTLATGALLSVSSSAPTLPAGFTKQRRIGVVRNDSGSDILPFIQRGKNNDRQYGYVQAHSVLVDGTATVFTAVVCSAFLPPTNNAAIVELTVKGDGSDGEAGEVRAVSTLPGNAAQIFNYGSKNGKFAVNTSKMVTDGSQNVEYREIGADGFVDLAIVGFDEEI